MTEDWSKEDRQAANMDTPCWESNDTELSGDDVKQLKKTLEARKDPYCSDAKRPIYRQEIRDDADEKSDTTADSSEDHYPGFIGTPDSNSFDPDI